MEMTAAADAECSTTFLLAFITTPSVIPESGESPVPHAVTPGTTIRHKRELSRCQTGEPRRVAGNQGSPKELGRVHFDENVGSAFYPARVIRPVAVLGMAGVGLLSACTSSTAPPPPPSAAEFKQSVRESATRYADEALDVQGSEGSVLVDERWGGECFVADVEVPTGQTYRVIMVNQGEPAAYEATAISQAFRLNDFVGNSDLACGATKTKAWGQRADGTWGVLR